MTPDQSRLDRSRHTTRTQQIWALIQGLRTPLRFMMSGAHPDDECAPMLAALFMRDGVNLSYACSTRGEGGQNDLGTERGPVLGALRTAEMEAACDVLSMRMYWLSDTPGDPINDWRLSKSGTETLDVWGKDRTLARMVHILRRDRPDMLCPTFLDVPGQHGHHRAMTQIAFEAFDAAADPGFAGSTLPVWQVAKLYLPAWSGAGRAYDDDLPPPPATVTIPGGGDDPVSGYSYALIGAQSHGHHRSQGMGHWPHTPRDFPLHLAKSRVGPDDSAVTDNLPHRFADIGLGALDGMVQDMCAALVDPARLVALAEAALDQIRSGDIPPDHAHRAATAHTQLSRILALAAGAVPRLAADRVWVRPGDTATLEQTGHDIAVPNGWTYDGAAITPSGDVPPEDGYRDHYDPLVPPLPAIRVTVPTGPEPAVSLWPLDRPVVADAARAVTLSPSSLMVNLATDTRSACAAISALHPAQGALSVDLPQGWRSDVAPDHLRLHMPGDAAEARHAMPLRIDGHPAHHVHHIDYPHIRATAAASPAMVQVSVVNVAVPDHRVGYIGAGLDTVPDRLSELGVQMVDLSAEGPAGLDGLSHVVIGIHAFRFNTALAQGIGALHDWVRAGGTLVTLYHRPWDNWDPRVTPPAVLEIGQPSLRWRVTNHDAPVTFLAPDHPILSACNIIQPSDFDGWVKERGLYFAKSWAPDYTPLFAMADPGEDPHHGAVLTAQIRRGRHTHCALNLHHQLEHMVPGAMRLLVNMIA